MGFWTRIKSLFHANLNALLDSAEDPQAALAQLVRDMERQAAEQRNYLAEAVITLRRLERDHEIHAQAARDYEQRARVILSHGDEANEYLARESIARKRQNEALASQLKAAAAQQREGVEALRRNLLRMQARIEEARARRRVLIARAHIAQAQQKIAKAAAAGTGNRAQDELARLEEKVNDASSRAEVDRELARGSTEVQLEEVGFGSEVDAELEELKREMALEDESRARKLLEE
jgi:phage shock protein A